MPRAPFLVAACAGASVWCAVAAADIVQTTDGQWKGVPGDYKLGPNDEPPTDAIGASASFKIDATYETVKGRGLSSSAGLVRDLWASDQETLRTFKDGLKQYRGNFLTDAAELFERAAAEEDVSPLGKQQALYLRALALAEAGQLEQAVAALDDLLAAVPNTYYFADAQLLRAKIALGNDAEVKRALDSIKNAKGMNRRDVARAEHLRIFLTLEQTRKYAEAKTAYEQLLKDLDRADPLEVGVVRDLARVGIGNALLRGDPSDPQRAKQEFEKALASSSNPDVLAAAHAGLGDVDFAAAKRMQDEKKMDEAKAALVSATEHYLRVTLVYRDQVADSTPVLTSLENQAKAFAALFDQSDGKDCLSAARAYSAYYDLHGMLEGAQKRRIALEAAAFNNKRKEKGCK